MNNCELVKIFVWGVCIAYIVSMAFLVTTYDPTDVVTDISVSSFTCSGCIFTRNSVCVGFHLYPCYAASFTYSSGCVGVNQEVSQEGVSWEEFKKYLYDNYFGARVKVSKNCRR